MVCKCQYVMGQQHRCCPIQLDRQAAFTDAACLWKGASISTCRDQGKRD